MAEAVLLPYEHRRG